VIGRHKRAGGACYELCDGQLAETAAGRQRVIMDVADLPGAFGGRAEHVVANALAAIAACRGAGIAVKDIKAALSTFAPAQVNPGRGNVYAVAAGPDAHTAASPVVVDYGHNAAALQATGQMVASVWGGEPVAAITLPGDRRDDLIAESAAAIATWFAKIVIYEDSDLRGRADGEMRALVTSAVKAARPDATIRHADGPQEALRCAVALAAGAPVLFLYEKLAAAWSALDRIGATPWPEDDLMGRMESLALADGLAGAVADAESAATAVPAATDS
jgi:cyanophycin synthetase